MGRKNKNSWEKELEEEFEKVFEKAFDNADEEELAGFFLEEEEPPDLVIELENNTVGLGGIIRGKFKITSCSEGTPIKSVRVEVVESKKDDEEDIGHIEFPYLGILLNQGQTIEEDFTIQNEIEFGHTNSKKIIHYIRVYVTYGDYQIVKEIPVTILPEKAESAEEDLNLHLYIEKPLNFLHASVRGKLRLFGFKRGFVISWNDRISVRDNGDNLLWQIMGPGRTVAISPDEKTLVAS